MTIQPGSIGSNSSKFKDGTKDKDPISSWWSSKTLNRAFKVVTDNPGYTLWGLSLALDPIRHLSSELGLTTLSSKISDRAFSDTSVSNLVVGFVQGFIFSSLWPNEKTSDSSESYTSRRLHAVAAFCNAVSFFSSDNKTVQSYAGWLNGIALARDFLLPLAPSISSKKASNIIEQKEGDEVTPESNLQNILEVSNKFREALDAKLIGQTEAKDTVVRAVIRHLMTIDLDDPNRATVLLLGPTGTGKTTLVKVLAEVIDRPVVIVDASNLTPEGYIGNSFSDTWKQLLKEAGGDQKKAEQGIVFIDEVDKLFKSTEGRSNHFQVIQNQLLKALEGGEVSAPGSTFTSSKPFNTKKMMFFLGGSFEGLARAQESDGVTVDQLEEYGLSREFTGRISNIAQLNSLNADQLHDVLKLEKGVASIPKWKKEFLNIGAELAIDEEVIDQIISYAVQRKTGVRGVDFVLRQFLTPILYQTLKDVFEQSNEKKSDASPLKVQVTMKEWNNSELARAEVSRNTFPSLDEIQNALKKKVVGQDKAKAVITEAIYNHHLNVKLGLNLPKGNVLMIGPSGCGKTYMMEVLSEETGLPLANIDASKFVREGIVGSNPRDAIIKLLEQTNGDVSAAEKGIIFLDEIDKQFEEVSNPMSGGGVSGRPILNQLLKMMQGDKVTVQYKGKSKTVDTTNILFVMAGAFSKFPKLYEKEKLEDDDLLRCGMTPEFLGRTGYITQLEQLNASHYREYLVGIGENALITNWVKAFEKMGAKLLVDDKVIEGIIETALKTKTGLRGLQNILRQQLSPKVLETQRRITAGEKDIVVHMDPIIHIAKEVKETPAAPDLVQLLSSSDFKETIKSGVNLVDFFAEWCGPCKSLAPVLEEVAAEKKDHVNFYKMNLDQAQDVANEFQVTSVPTLILFKDGKEVNRVVGLQDGEAIKALIAESE